MQPYISSLRIKGFKAFWDTSFAFGHIEVIAGANGSGKTSLFELLRFVRDASREPIPPEIIKGSLGQEIFHDIKDESFQFSMDIHGFRPFIVDDTKDADGIKYNYYACISGPRGSQKVLKERLYNLNAKEEIFDKGYSPEKINTLLGEYPYPNFAVLEPAARGKNVLPNYFYNWRFFAPAAFDTVQMRRARFVEQNPQLDENGGNITAVLHFLMTEHPELFDELHVHLRNIIPSFKRITVKARGGPGEVLAYWQEEGLDRELTIADLSDGTIRLICWIALCLHPSPPSLICIDEPEMGLHPRALPVLAGLFKKASEHTQLLIATHSSYLLTLFDIGDIAVMKKKNGDIVYAKPKDSAALSGVLDDFGPEEIETMHRSDELEALS